MAHFMMIWKGEKINMGMFVGNTYTKVEDVRSKYREVNKYDIDGIKNGEYDNEITNDRFVNSNDYDDRLDKIESDIYQIIQMLQGYDLSGAIDELKILVEKLY